MMTPPVVPMSIAGDLAAQLHSKSVDEILRTPCIIDQINKLPESQRNAVQTYLSSKTQYEAACSARDSEAAEKAAGWAAGPNLTKLTGEKTNLTRQQDADQKLFDALALLQTHVHFTFDSRLTKEELASLAGGGDANLAAAAKLVLTYPHLLTSNDWGGSMTGNGMKSAIESLRKALDSRSTRLTDLDGQIADAQTIADRAKNTPATDSGSNKADSTEKNEEKQPTESFDVDGTGPLPKSSNRPGLDGAIDNLTGMIDWVNDEIKRLSNPKLSDEDKAKAQEKLKELAIQQAQLQQMHSQLFNLRLTIMNMLNDMANSAIKNMRS